MEYIKDAELYTDCYHQKQNNYIINVLILKYVYRNIINQYKQKINNFTWLLDNCNGGVVLAIRKCISN